MKKLYHRGDRRSRDRTVGAPVIAQQVGPSPDNKPSVERGPGMARAVRAVTAGVPA